VLLHGDLQHTNILSAERAPWLAIDPKGVVGDRGYDVGPFLINADPQRAPSRETLESRMRIFAVELDYDRLRLRDWAIAHAVMSAIWSAEDEGHGWEPAIEVALTLRTL
jgi:streptomycin 6-kinase